MSESIYQGRVYLIVRRKARGGYSGDALLARVSNRRPHRIAQGEYVLPLKIAVPSRLLDNTAGWISVQAAEPSEPIVEPNQS